MAYRILHCLRAPIGGLFRHVADLAKAQAESGHAVGVICDATSCDALSKDKLADLTNHLSLGLHRVPMSRSIGLSDVGAYAATRNIAKTHNVTILHGHGAKGGAYARLAGKTLRRANRDIACFYTPHGGSLHYDPASPKGRIYMALERQLARHTAGILFESAYSAGIYRKKIGEPPCLTAIVPNGLLPNEFDPVCKADKQADFVFVGELRHLKGVDVLLQALKLVRTNTDMNCYNARVKIFGDGPDADQFKALSRELGLDDAVSFPGAIPARHAFCWGKTLVMPSRAESFPYIILEAAAAGLPILANDVGGIGEIIAGTDTALLPADDPKALATAMTAALRDPQRAAEQAAELKAHVRCKFTVAAMAGAIEKLYAKGLQPSHYRQSRLSVEHQ